MDFRRERLGDLVAVDRLDHIEKENRVMRLVGLQGADEMEFEIGMARFQRRPFFQRLLDPVLAEHTLTRRDHGHNVLGAKGLGDADEGHALRIAPGVARGAGNPGAHQGEAIEGGFGRSRGGLQSFGL